MRPRKSFCFFFQKEAFLSTRMDSPGNLG